jgi:hypothetical protein
MAIAVVPTSRRIGRSVPGGRIGEANAFLRRAAKIVGGSMGIRPGPATVGRGGRRKRSWSKYDYDGGSMEKGEGFINVVVIGGGTAGLVTAAGTAGLGGRVALIERQRMGGDCLNTGCVPSKALISSARLVEQIRQAEKWGLLPQEPQFRFDAVLGRMREATSYA